jgi:hypothetical protein
VTATLGLMDHHLPDVVSLAEHVGSYLRDACGDVELDVGWRGHPASSPAREREIRWTSESEAHIARHGVTPEEVEQPVNSRPRYEALGREDATLLYCATDRAAFAGRPG